MLNYVEFNFDYMEYHEKLSDYILSLSNTITSSYQTIDLLNFKKYNNSLCKYLENMANSDLERVIVITVSDLFKVTPHTDVGPRVCRINWPILNGTSADTVFYHAKETSKTFTVQGITMYHRDDLLVADRFKLTRPSLMNVDTIHSVEPVVGAPLPRIIASFNFKDDTTLQTLLAH